MGYALAGMRFNSVSTRHTSDTFHVCYEVMSVNTAEPRCAMHDSDRRNTGKSVDRGSVTERSVVGAAERSGIKKNKGKIAISLHNGGEREREPGIRIFFSHSTPQHEQQNDKVLGVIVIFSVFTYILIVYVTSMNILHYL